MCPRPQPLGALSSVPGGQELSGTRLPGCESWFCPFLAPCLRTSGLSFLCLGGLIYTREGNPDSLHEGIYMKGSTFPMPLGWALPSRGQGEAAGWASGRYLPHGLFAHLYFILGGAQPGGG